MRDWTQLCRVANEVEGRLVAGYLEAQGVEVDIQLNDYNPYPENLGMLAAVIVRVPAEDLARAEELLAELPQAEIDGVPELAGDEPDGADDAEGQQPGDSAADDSAPDDS